MGYTHTHLPSLTPSLGTTKVHGKQIRYATFIYIYIYIYIRKVHNNGIWVFKTYLNFNIIFFLINILNSLVP